MIYMNDYNLGILDAQGRAVGIATRIRRVPNIGPLRTITGYRYLTEVYSTFDGTRQKSEPVTFEGKSRAVAELNVIKRVNAIRRWHLSRGGCIQ